MAELKIEDNNLVLELSRLEKAEGVHGNLRVPVSSVQSVEVLDDAHAPADHGFKFGTRLYGMTEVGTMSSKDKKVFAVVHRNTPRGIRVVLKGESHDEWIVGCDNPEEIVSAVSTHLTQ